MTIEYKDSKRISMTSNVTFEQASNNDSRTFGVGGRTALGVKLSAGHSLVGATVRTFSVIVNQDPSGAGDIKAYVIRSGYGSNDQVAESTASTLPTGTGNTTFNITFTFSSDVSILANDIIAFTNVGMTSVSSAKTSSSNIDPNAEALCVVSGTAFTFSDFVTMSGTYNNLAYKTTSTAKPTNVQDNSILVEKDTGRRYWFDGTDWTMEPTFRDEYTGGWTTNSGTGVAVSGGEVTWNIAGNQSNQISKAIGSTLSDTAWVAQFEVELSAYSSGEANIVALSSGTSVQSQSSTDNSIICGFGDVGRYSVWVRTGNGSDYSNLGSIDRPANGTRHYITLIRTSSTEVKLYVRTGSHTGSQVANSPQTITTQISNVTGLSNVLHGGWNTGNSGRTLTMVGDNLKIYNGVTTIN